MKPKVAITLGDPAGVGPEICKKALADASLHDLATWFVVADQWMWNDGPRVDGRPMPILHDISEWAEGPAILAREMIAENSFRLGQVDPVCGAASLDYVRTATQMCLDRQIDAMVTAPICKEAVVKSGVEGFCGHTEFIGQMCQVESPRLMLYHENLSIVHVSTHVSLSQAIELCKTDRIVETIKIGHNAICRLGVERPRVAVCGLNPHASENGLFGTEEATQIAPAVNQAKQLGIDCSGPYPADTVLLRAAHGAFDLVVAMYHDQGHAPMKLYDFSNCVNVTLGLPIIRTSVDHGTAFDIAGKGVADEHDLKCAMRLAVRLVGVR